MSNENLRQSILQTIAYFDIFDYPLTQFEVWKWLYPPNRVGDPSWATEQNHKGSDTRLEGKCVGDSFVRPASRCEAGAVTADEQDSSATRWEGRLSDVIDVLENMVSENIIETLNGFYFLPGRREIIRIRLDRYNIAEIKYKKAVRLVKFLSLIPYIKMIAVCNTLGYSNSRRQADIDFFIITAKNRIWISRFLTTFFLKICGLRPKGKNLQDKFCLSFFVSEDNLNLQDLTLGQNDIYFQFWLTQLVPVYNTDGTYEKFLKANSWDKSYLPNCLDFQTSRRRRVKDRCKLFKKIWNFLTTNLDEKFYKWLQLKILPKKLKDLVNQDTRVVLTDQVLKFHDNDRRKIYRDLWERKVTAMLSS